MSSKVIIIWICVVVHVQHLSGFDKRYPQKFQVRFNNLTLEVNKNSRKSLVRT